MRVIGRAHRQGCATQLKLTEVLPKSTSKNFVPYPTQWNLENHEASQKFASTPATFKLVKSDFKGGKMTII
jgi:hypothetical protein